MSKIDKLTEKVMKFAQYRYIKIIMNSFMAIAAFSIGGSLFSLVASIPIPFYQDFLVSSGLGEILRIPITMVSNLYAIMLVLAIGYEVAKSFKQSPLPAAMVAFGSFMIVTPFVAQVTITTEAGEAISGLANNVIPIASLGSQGIFLAVMIGLLAARIYVYLLEKEIKLKMPENIPPSVAGMFETMIPAGIVFTLFIVFRVVFQQTEYGTMQSFIYTIVQKPLLGIGGTPLGAALYLMAGKLLWMFGIHGDMLTYATLGTIRQATSQANMAAFAAGEAVPFLEWGLLTPLTNLGILALTLLLLTSKAKQHKSFGRIAISTSIFNITEPVMFGLPVILNPILFVPFVLSPGISLFLTSIVMKIGLVAPLTGVGLSNVIPTPIYLWMATNSISGLIWGLLLVLINVLIYFPFFKISERAAAKEEISMKETLN